MTNFTINIPYAAKPFVNDKRFVEATANTVRSWVKLRDDANDLPQQEMFAALDRAKLQFFDYMVLFLTRLANDHVPFKPTPEQAAMLGYANNASRVHDVAMDVTWYLAFCKLKDD